MSYRMTKDDVLRFLGTGTRTAKLATVRADGSPHVSPVWFVLDGEDLVLTTGADTVKGRNLRRDPRVCVCVDDEEPPFGYVMVRGDAELSEDPDALRTWATRIGGRYMGEERAREFGARNAAPGELLVRVRPRRVVAEGGLTE
ncbi:PPOX class F420-dependent oxidoreductase [Streptomyces marincola]|uniref:PPOX class F420-dependent enzyme n=1 Tax=Streptomyces marincola TaxID=2878388 RepID=A0A1W7D4G7_9ACTN|nr:PPOX class F420-dependent oxidoreductase [Streptomyces marincola]ARQ71916.1 PPOX class F420-dependent enzyme [Streptomyces marincola]